MERLAKEYEYLKQLAMKPKYYIGIDPDVERSGVACVDVRNRCVTWCVTWPFAVLLDNLRMMQEMGGQYRHIVEASWMTTKNWHLPKTCSLARAAAMGRSVGRNHATGEHIVAWCRHLGLDVVEQPPLRKCWRGRDGKITHAELAQFVEGLPKRTNQEERDAVLLAWTAAGLPIKISIKQLKTETK